MGILDSIESPADLRKLDDSQLRRLTEEIREFLILNVTQTGGHLGPNLGVVELTVGIHRVFNSPRDAILFDTGHQSYVHKLVTGRRDFSGLRQRGGLSGYPDREESIHDIVESSHASSSLSWADGISRAWKISGESDRYVVALIGDGALTGGMTWEALNNIATDKERKVVIVVNDNGRSYAPTVGGLANYFQSLRPALDSVRTHKVYEHAMSWTKEHLQNGGTARQLVYKSLHATKKGIKDWWAPQGLFEDLGVKYLGPVDGHDLKAVEAALKMAKNFSGPVLVHALTEKGHGYPLARADCADQFHAVGAMDPRTGASREQVQALSWTSVFAEEMEALAEERPDMVGITAAMPIPVGLHRMAQRYPDRVIDVGIAEQHALTAAAGMAYGGLHPVVAVYATFLNRAFDQLLMDVALHGAGVTVVLDRAGVTGPDGPSHHGIWDLALAAIVPGVHLAVPRDAVRLREELREALNIDYAPTVLRYPKGAVGEALEAQARLDDGVDILRGDGDSGVASDLRGDVLMIGLGALCRLALHVAEGLEAQGTSSSVVDPRWVLPVAHSLVDLASRHHLVVLLEEGIETGGVGAHLRRAMELAGVRTPLEVIGLPTAFLEHGPRAALVKESGLNVEAIVSRVEDILSSSMHRLDVPKNTWHY